MRAGMGANGHGIWGVFMRYTTFSPTWAKMIISKDGKDGWPMVEVEIYQQESHGGEQSNLLTMGYYTSISK